MQIILTAQNIDAREAHRIGLVNEVVEPARLIARAEELLLQIIANAPLAVRLSMEAVNHGLEAGQAQGLALESALFALCASTDDKRRGHDGLPGASAAAVQRPMKQARQATVVGMRTSGALAPVTKQQRKTA